MENSPMPRFPRGRLSAGLRMASVSSVRQSAPLMCTSHTGTVGRQPVVTLMHLPSCSYLLVKRCWNLDVEKRIGASELCKALRDFEDKARAAGEVCRDIGSLLNQELSANLRHMSMAVHKRRQTMAKGGTAVANEADKIGYLDQVGTRPVDLCPGSVSKRGVRPGWARGLLSPHVCRNHHTPAPPSCPRRLPPTRARGRVSRPWGHQARPGVAVAPWALVPWR